ncbi:MAG: NlpC/P60 family protein [Cellulosilyticaceae bacterium]
MPFRNILCVLVMCIATLLVPTITFGQAYGQITTEKLDLRSNPLISSPVIGQINKNEEVEIVAVAGEDWFEIITSKGERAFISVADVAIVEADGLVAGSGVRLRDYPSVSNSKILDTLYSTDAIIIEYIVGDWCKVLTKGKEGFVSKEFIQSPFMNKLSVKQISDVERIVQKPIQSATGESPTWNNNSQKEPENVAPEKDPIKVGTGRLGKKVVQDAMQFVGGRYVYGGNDLYTGVDCSGFTQQIMKRHGVNISRSSSSQYANDGYAIKQNEIEQGDLVFYGYNGVISHVAIYIGNGQVIHSGTKETGIMISSISNIGKPYIGAKRVL